MKKNIFNIFLATLFTLCVLPGCTKFLTRDAKNQTTDDQWWMTKNQLNTVVNECYMAMNPGTVITSTSYFNIPWNTGALVNYTYGHLLDKIENEGLSDNGITCANYIDNSAITSGTASPKHSNISNFWQGRYCSIRLCSRFLEHYGQAIFDPDKQPHEGIQTVDRWAAEVRALRAYYHLDLFMNFGEIPLVDHVISPAEQFLVRQPREKCVEWIANEFIEASNNLPVEPQNSEERWRWTKGACYAYLSYLYMFESKWEEAKQWAQAVIDLGKYDIYVSPDNKATSYTEQFLYAAYTNNTKESILTRNMGCMGTTGRLLCPGYKNGGTGVCPTASLVDAYELADGRTISELSEVEQANIRIFPKSMPRDPRLEMTVLFPNETFLGYTNDVWTYDPSNLDYIGKRNSTKSGYWVKKWCNETDLNNPLSGKLPFQLMRYSVILLNYVEAQIELGNLDDPLIYTYLNKIRSRAGQPDVNKTKYATQEKLRELVRRERRVELAFEGHRLYDIRRWKIGNEVMNGDVYGAKCQDKDELYLAETRSFNPARDYVWPIPATEMTANTSMTQNYGY